MLRQSILRSQLRILQRAPRFTRQRYVSTKVGGENHVPKSQSRIERLNARLPRFLRHLITPLLTAPVSHITAFLILHEITAIVPLFGFAAAFHYFDWLPPYLSEGAWATKGVTMFGNYLRRKGWIDQEEGRKSWKERGWNIGEGGTRVVVELATAYAVTKALLPLRLMVSVWGTPWFARISVIPLSQKVKKIFSKKKVQPSDIVNEHGKNVH
ncbi:hypothetical protein M501DRAFT_1014030 [Patellaria atrata CBS 101060]|uniref:Uncharacterized protein n=1 Tax=Patellaria atrata CBS 101060 TaxID=1346257 RepID=A0A9P4SG92_9PEZI|nr:hypothetical protein M501DRAFT_1014030 [Patellaria atrata CBS 101060]